MKALYRCCMSAKRRAKKRPEQRRGEIGRTESVAILLEIIQESLPNLTGSPLRTTRQNGSHPEQRERNSPVLGCAVAEKVRMMECSGNWLGWRE